MCPLSNLEMLQQWTATTKKKIFFLRIFVLIHLLLNSESQTIKKGTDVSGENTMMWCKKGGGVGGVGKGNITTRWITDFAIPFLGLKGIKDKPLLKKEVWVS